MESKRKKITTAVIAGVTAVALLIGGTFAWQSISQTALNEKEAVINPGGRLHDDFNGTNKDVYVENFGEEKIFARVRLDEYFEIVTNKGTAIEEVEKITENATKDNTDTYLTHKFGADAENATDDYFTWSFGGETVYMPTFDKNKDSLRADVNGTLNYKDSEGNAKPYGDYVTYEENEELTDDAVYDADSNTVDEFADDSAQENINYVLVNETHIAKKTGTATLISMDEWKNDYAGKPGNYWVYDTDGWVYWANAIEPDTATGLLLDEIKLNAVMDDSYYYAINVTGQFVTADDLGIDDNTGFYADEDNLPSEDALALLKAIGVKTDDETVLVAGLYDANDKLLCTWEKCGIDLEPDDDLNLASNYSTVETSGYYVLTNNYPNTTKVILPEDATSIGDWVFCQCDNLTEVDIKNVETLGYGTFDACSSLTTVNGAALKTIGDCCFRQCSSLTTVDTSNVETLNDAAFQDTYALTPLDLSNVKTVGGSVFYCSYIKELDLSNAEIIGNMAFNCAYTEKIYLDKVTKIDSYAFSYMPNLQAIVYKGTAYTNVDALKAALTENGVTLSNYAFDGCQFWEPTVNWEWELLDLDGKPTDREDIGTISMVDYNYTEFTYTGEGFFNSNVSGVLNFRISNTEDNEENEIEVTGYHFNLTGWLDGCNATSENDYYVGYINNGTWIAQCQKKQSYCPAFVNVPLDNHSVKDTNYLEIVVEYNCKGMSYESKPLKFTFTGTRK